MTEITQKPHRAPSLHPRRAPQATGHQPPATGHGPPATGHKPPPTAHRRDAGVVMVLALLGILLLAALVFYVFNVGRHVQQRVETQHAADAAATAGAGWVARSLNTVSRNNIQIARLIAAVNVLDASDEAIHPAYHEVSAWRRALEPQVPSPTGTRDLNSAERTLLREQMGRVLDRLRSDERRLGDLKGLMRAPDDPPEYASPSGSFDVRDYTFYQHNGRRGRLWRAMTGLDAYSQATMQSLGALAQVSARQIGGANLGDPDADATDRAGTALMLPFLPVLPWERGSFTDFERPVRQGLLPERIDDERMNRGPWDVLFGWRTPVFEQEIVRDGERVPGGSGPSGPGGLGPRSGRWDPPPQRERFFKAYRTFGPLDWLLDSSKARWIGGSPASYRHMNYAHFYHWRDQFARWKIGYLFDGRNTKSHHLPIWRTDWSQITSIAGNTTEGGGGAIEKTKYFTLRIESEVPRTSPDFLSSGTFSIEQAGDLTTMHGGWSVPDNPCARPRSTNDPRYWQQKLVEYRQECPQFGNLSLRRQEQWRSARYAPISDRAWRFGSEMWRWNEQTEQYEVAYQYMYYFVLGVDVGESRAIRNPHNFDDPSALPAPVMLDRSRLPRTKTAFEREHLRYFAVAQQPNDAAFWPARFDADRPYPNAVAVAQAQVFNNHSLDIWTPMWHAQLQRVQDYEGWVNQYTSTAGDATAVGGVSARTVEQIGDYLRRTEDLAEVMLNH